MANKRAQVALDLLKRVLSGTMAVDVALVEWPDIDDEVDELLTASWHDLSHYAADQDIRDKDPRFSDYQTNLLTRRIKEIQAKFNLD